MLQTIDKQSRESYLPIFFSPGRYGYGSPLLSEKSKLESIKKCCELAEGDTVSLINEDIDLLCQKRNKLINKEK